VCNERCPLDKKVHLCTQTENGVSVRTYQTGLHYAKAIAYVRGNRAVELEDLRQILPWVLHEKVVPNTRSPFFDVKGKRVLLQDRVSWIRSMFDTAMEQYRRHAPVRNKVMALREQLDQGLRGVDAGATRERMGRISSLISELMKKSELSGAVYEDLIHLKSMYSRYNNYALWQKRQT